MLLIKTAPFSFVTNSFEYCSRYATAATTSAINYTTRFAKTFASGVSQILPDWKVKSISSVIAQATEHGSAILDLGIERGELFLEVTRNEEGQRVFTATGGMLQPIVLVENAEEVSRAIWEAKVAQYLMSCIDENTTEDYGIVGQRWKGTHFLRLKSFLEEQELWEAEEARITLSLPDSDEKLAFVAPYAEQKAEIVLKYLYHRKRTPIEEDASRGLDFFTRLFIEYAAVTGPLLAPWTAGISGRKNALLPVIDFNKPTINTTLPSIITNGATSNVIIYGRYLYVMTASGLAVYDYIDSSDPVLLQTVAGLTSPNLRLGEGCIYAFTEGEGAFVFDLADPANPTLVTTATLDDGTPLPEFINFNPASQTFSVTAVVGTRGAYPIRMTAGDMHITFNMWIPGADQPYCGHS